jgi:hypothetical protein
MKSFFRLFIFCCCLFTTLTLSAQEFSGGFRAGLNFASFDGDMEMSADGTTTFESFKTYTGFHVGATFALEFTDLVGIKADLMYSQRGGQIDYEGPSYFYLYQDRNDTNGEINFGRRSSEMDVVNSYIDIPLVAYYRLGPFEIEGGASAGFMVSSRTSGGVTYSGTRFGADEEIIFNFEGNYYRDGAGGQSILTLSETPLPRTEVRPPASVGAYYNSNSDESLYRRLDFGLIAGVSLFLNNGLYVGVRYQHGLTDVTQGENDLRLTNENSSASRSFNTDDVDNNRNIAASVGFRF